MNWRIASSVACDVGLAAMDVEARAEDDDDAKLPAEEEEDEEEKLVVPEVEVGWCRRRKRMLQPVRKSDMWDVWKRSMIFWYLFAGPERVRVSEGEAF